MTTPVKDQRYLGNTDILSGFPITISETYNKKKPLYSRKGKKFKTRASSGKFSISGYPRLHVFCRSTATICKVTASDLAYKTLLLDYKI